MLHLLYSKILGIIVKRPQNKWLAHICMHGMMYMYTVYMLCAKFGLKQFSDCPAQNSDLSFAQQSSDCLHNPQIAPNEVHKVSMKDHPRHIIILIVGK